MKVRQITGEKSHPHIRSPNPTRQERTPCLLKCFGTQLRNKESDLIRDSHFGRALRVKGKEPLFQRYRVKLST